MYIRITYKKLNLKVKVYLYFVSGFTTQTLREFKELFLNYLKTILTNMVLDRVKMQL